MTARCLLIVIHQKSIVARFFIGWDSKVEIIAGLWRCLLIFAKAEITHNCIHKVQPALSFL